jgi:hypothetical protein
MPAGCRRCIGHFSANEATNFSTDVTKKRNIIGAGIREGTQPFKKPNVCIGEEESSHQKGVKTNIVGKGEMRNSVRIQWMDLRRKAESR